MTRCIGSPASRVNTRRDFLKAASAATAAGALAGGLPIARGAHAAGDDLLRIGLIGCGGRGTGAAVNAIKAGGNCKFTAMADIFTDRLQHSRKMLNKQANRIGMPEKVAVEEDQCFVGFDAADKLLASDVDVVILTEPPHFRPAHLKAAIDAGKHVFCEKPVAVDAPGIRSILATAEEAKKKTPEYRLGFMLALRPGDLRDYEAHSRRRHRPTQVHPGNLSDVAPFHIVLVGPSRPRWSINCAIGNIFPGCVGRF